MGSGPWQWWMGPETGGPDTAKPDTAKPDTAKPDTGGTDPRCRTAHRWVGRLRRRLSSFLFSCC